MNQPIFTLKIGGTAGQGIKTTGLLFAKVATRSGYYIFDHTEYGSLVRGGHNVMQINTSIEPVTAPSLKTDLLIALNQETIDKYCQEMTSASAIIYDLNASLDLSKVKKTTALVPVPLAKLAQDSGGNELLSNTAAIGATLALLSGSLVILKYLINEEYTGEESHFNERAAEAGFEYAIAHFPKDIKKIIIPIDSDIPKVIINGNEATALGAINGGLQLAAIYPMTPMSNLLTILAALQERYGYIYKQPEDELAAINMAIGASYAGVRSLTATSGGGFCLMTEAYGLAGMTETPLVIIEGMRPGPATGLPTWSEQGDLQFVLHAHQGDFPKIVLAPGDAKEAFYLTREALNLADKYQTPVVILVDKNICECDQSFDLFDVDQYRLDRGKVTTEVLPDYKRYATEPDGISARALPGSGNFFMTNSDEHDAYGYSSEEVSDRLQQMNKRMTKLTTCEASDLPAPTLYGPANASVTIVSWGSTKGSILTALKNFDNVNFLQLTWLNPFPTNAVKNVLTKANLVVDIESNYTGQLADLIAEKTGIEITDRLLKYDGRPFYPEEISIKLEKILKGKL